MSMAYRPILCDNNAYNNSTPTDQLFVLTIGQTNSHRYAFHTHSNHRNPTSLNPKPRVPNRRAPRAAASSGLMRRWNWELRSRRKKQPPQRQGDIFDDVTVICTIRNCQVLIPLFQHTLPQTSVQLTFPPPRDTVHHGVSPIPGAVVFEHPSLSSQLDEKAVAGRKCSSTLPVGIPMYLAVLVYRTWLTTGLGFLLDESGRLDDGIEFAHVHILDKVTEDSRIPHKVLVIREVWSKNNAKSNVYKWYNAGSKQKQMLVPSDLPEEAPEAEPHTRCVKSFSDYLVPFVCLDSL